MPPSVLSPSPRGLVSVSVLSERTFDGWAWDWVAVQQVMTWFSYTSMFCSAQDSVRYVHVLQCTRQCTIRPCFAVHKAVYDTSMFCSAQGSVRYVHVLQCTRQCTMSQAGDNVGVEGEGRYRSNKGK